MRRKAPPAPLIPSVRHLQPIFVALVFVLSSSLSIYSCFPRPRLPPHPGVAVLAATVTPHLPTHALPSVFLLFWSSNPGHWGAGTVGVTHQRPTRTLHPAVLGRGLDRASQLIAILRYSPSRGSALSPRSFFTDACRTSVASPPNPADTWSADRVLSANRWDQPLGVEGSSGWRHLCRAVTGLTPPQLLVAAMLPRIAMKKPPSALRVISTQSLG
jgi:hypothetical protein